MTFLNGTLLRKTVSWAVIAANIIDKTIKCYDLFIHFSSSIFQKQAEKEKNNCMNAKHSAHL